MNDKIMRRGVPFSREVASLVSRMPVVDEYRESMLRLQSLWDSLSMLGQMSGTVPDIGTTRSEFQSLTETLLDSLARSLLSHALKQMRGQAQVTIDILVRNLFERTADVGFLSSDSELVAFASAADESGRDAIEARFRDYVAKYSVYDDVVVMNPRGQVIARLDRDAQADECSEAWVCEAAQASGYIERAGTSSLMDGRAALLYAQAIRGERGTVVGVLCLSFRFDDEMQAIFAQLRDNAGRGVIALIDARQRVVASSDPWQVPLGAQLPGEAAGGDHQRQRFAGRDYLRVTTSATPYEGYLGPGWRACVLVPTELAFEPAEDAVAGQRDQAIDGLVGALDTRELFAEELHRIPRHAARIQRDLSRVLWNGRLRPATQTHTGAGAGNDFAGTLLREVGHTGEQIRLLFAQATGNLHRSALAAVFDTAHARSRLAIDIMDRNLYERANDCRWWALANELRHLLAQPHDQRDASSAAAVLKNINRLYTVYSTLLVFDARGQIVAVSQPAAREWVGRSITADWLKPTLALRDGQAFQVSAHEPSPLYADAATYVYSAAVLPSNGGPALGGIAIVFDGTPQFAAMLRDALPTSADGTPLPGSSALFVSRSGQVVASTDVRWPVGSVAPLLPQALARGQSTTTVIDIDGIAHAAAFSMAGGYREYHGNPQAPADDVAALVLMRLGQRLPQIDGAVPAFVPPAAPRRASNDAALEIASFVAGGQWLGLPVAQVHTALEHPRIAALPGTPAHLLGMLPFEGRMLMAIDLGALRGGPPASPDSPVIVVHGPNGRRMALRVQELGPVFMTADADLQSVALGSSVGAMAQGDKLVRSDGQMLTLLDAERLYGLCGLAA